MAVRQKRPRENEDNECSSAGGTKETVSSLTPLEEGLVWAYGRGPESIHVFMRRFRRACRRWEQRRAQGGKPIRSTTAAVSTATLQRLVFLGERSGDLFTIAQQYARHDDLVSLQQMARVFGHMLVSSSQMLESALCANSWHASNWLLCEMQSQVTSAVAVGACLHQALEGAKEAFHYRVIWMFLERHRRWVQAMPASLFGRAFSLACAFGKVRLAQSLWELRPPESTPGDFPEALIVSSRMGHRQCVDWLLKSEWSARDRDSEAFLLACRNSHTDIAKLLLDKGANPYCFRSQALRAVLRLQNEPLLREMVRHGVCLFEKSIEHVRFAVQCYSVESIAMLFRVFSGSFPLVKPFVFRVACSQGRADIVRYCVATTVVESSIRTTDVRNGARLALRKGHAPVLEILQTHPEWSKLIEDVLLHSGPDEDVWGDDSFHSCVENCDFEQQL